MCGRETRRRIGALSRTFGGTGAATPARVAKRAADPGADARDTVPSGSATEETVTGSCREQFVTRQAIDSGGSARSATRRVSTASTPRPNTSCRASFRLCSRCAT